MLSGIAGALAAFVVPFALAYAAGHDDVVAQDRACTHAAAIATAAFLALVPWRRRR